MQRIEGMFRTVKDGVESKIGKRLRKGSRVIPWLVKHAADLINRYGIQPDGKTAYHQDEQASFHPIFLF